nr:4-hydroxythreonine-4-phosphate dehydrogenase PdxA [Kofleriaceae bacterium]
MTRLGITLGCPAGVGPEIVVRALSELGDLARGVIIYGDRGPLERAARACGVAMPDVPIVGDGVGEHARAGQPDDACGAAQVGYLEAALAAAKRGELAALATAPISKTWAKRAGFAFPGHTEFLAARLDAPRVAMMFAGPKLRVVLATVHVPLREVAGALTTRGVRDAIELVADALVRDFAIAAPRIGVVGLNPHAGEGGLLGGEDEAIIAPALAEPLPPATLHGPLVPDAAFRAHADGRYDALVAMYHDQALIPVKLLDFEDSVNVTLGLPLARTSPDHGTAYDIAGRGVARATSMRRALELAARTVRVRSDQQHANLECFQ